MLQCSILILKLSLLFENLARHINFLLFDLFALVVTREKLPWQPNYKINKLLSKTCPLNWISQHYLNRKLRFSHLHLVARVLAMEPNFEFWTFVLWCSILIPNMSLLFEILAIHINFLLFLCTCSCSGKAALVTNLQDSKTAFKDLSYEPNVKAVSQLQAEIQPVARVVAMEANL